LLHRDWKGIVIQKVMRGIVPRATWSANEVDHDMTLCLVIGVVIGALGSGIRISVVLPSVMV
jgi:hypothetical protein